MRKSNIKASHSSKRPAIASIVNWQAGPPTSEIRFTLRHPTLPEISGRAARWTASFVLDPLHFARSSVEVVVDAASLETGATERDNHARSAEFLDVTTYPKIGFRSREVRLDDDHHRFIVVGALTIRDVTRDVTLVVENRERPGRPGPTRAFTIRTSISRSDFGLRWHQEVDTGEPVAGDQVDLEIEIEARPDMRAGSRGRREHERVRARDAGWT